MSSVGVRPLPRSEEAEAAVLGSLVIAPDLLPEVAAILDSDDFYASRHAEVYRAILAVDSAGEVPDVLAVARELQLSDIDPVFVRDLAENVTVVAAALGHARTVARLAVDRRVILRLSSALEDAMREADPADLAAEVTADLIDLTAKAADPTAPLSELIDDVVSTFEAGPSLGMPTGFRGLDSILGGLLPGQLVLVAARPGVGKTAFASAIASNVAKRALPVAFVTYEMSAEEIATRLLCSEASVSYQALRAGRATPDDWRSLLGAVGTFVDSALTIVDDATARLPQARIAVRRVKGLALVVVDYIQLMPSSNTRGNRQEQVAEISRGLKLLARELNVPVVACCQLNRQAEQRQDKRPKLQDLRESGALEQDADVVILLHREDANPVHAEVIVAKQRNGPTGSVRISFEREHTSFRDLGW